MRQPATDRGGSRGGSKKRRTRRTRTAHPGVKERRRTWASGAVTYFARFVDPDTGKERDENLTALGLTSADARRAWMIRKAQALAARKADLAVGAPKHTGAGMAEGLDLFLSSVENFSTRATYEEGVARLRAWAIERGIGSTDELFAHHIAQFREWLRKQPKQTPVKGGRKGERRAGASPVKASSLNNRLRSVKACLNWLRKQGRLPHVNAEAIREGLEAFKGDEDPPRFLGLGEIRDLLNAALAHDTARFSATREEHARHRLRGSTPRYQAMGTFVLAALLGGLREGELRRLTWPMVLLDAPDEHGNPAGEIRLPGSATKTGKARTIDLGISPALRRALIAHRLRTGGEGYVFGGPRPWSRSLVESARRRLVRAFAAPAFTWQDLRSTCATYHVNMPGVPIWHEPVRLGHDVKVAQRYYLGLVRGIAADARTLEQAMGIVELAATHIAPSSSAAV